MTNVIQFPGSKKPTTKKPAGTVEVYAEGPNMAMFEGCIPVALMPALMALFNTAGVPVTRNA